MYYNKIFLPEEYRAALAMFFFSSKLSMLWLMMELYNFQFICSLKVYFQDDSHITRSNIFAASPSITMLTDAGHSTRLTRFHVLSIYSSNVMYRKRSSSARFLTLPALRIQHQMYVLASGASSKVVTQESRKPRPN